MTIQSQIILADPDASEITERRLRARQRAEAFLEAWNALTAWEANHAADFVISQVAAGRPVPPFTTFAAEAADWAAWAHPEELIAYAAACLFAPGGRSPPSLGLPRRAGA